MGREKEAEIGKKGGREQAWKRKEDKWPFDFADI